MGFWEGREYRWVISAILGLANSHGSTTPSPLETCLTPQHDGILGVGGESVSVDPLSTLSLTLRDAFRNKNGIMWEKFPRAPRV